MPCTEAYEEHIMYTFNGYCKTVIRYAVRQLSSRMENLPPPCSSSVLMNSHTLKLNNRRYIERTTEQPKPEIPQRPVLPPEAAAYPKLLKVKTALDKQNNLIFKQKVNGQNWRLN